MQKKIAVVLCGCGAKDGSEIHESVSTLIAIDQSNAIYQCFAPQGAQARTINHVTASVQSDERSMLVEGARIARGAIRDLKELKAAEFDALIFPGGFGAAHNLFNFAEKGLDCVVHPDVEETINLFYSSKKPIGFICIAPVLAAKVLGKYEIQVTIGNDSQAIKAITTFGAKHIVKEVKEVHVDRTNKIVSTPAYMLANRISDVYTGVSQLVLEVLRLT